MVADKKGFVLRQSLLTSVYILVGTALGAIVMMLQPGILSKAAIGLSRNMINGGTVLQSAIILGFHTVIITFLPRYPAHSGKPAVLLTAGLLLPVAVAGVLCLPYFGLRHWIVGHYQLQDRPLLLRYFALLPVLTLTWSFMTVLESYLAARLRVAVAAFARELLPRITNATLLLLCAAGVIGLDGFMVGTALMYLPAVVIMLVAAVRSGNFRLSARWSELSAEEWREAGRFAWYHLLAGITFQLIGFLDALMLAPLDAGGVESVAVYSIAVLVASFVMIPYRAISSSASPLLNRAYFEKDDALVRRIFDRSGANMAIAGVLMAVLIGCNLPNLLRLLPAGAGYEAVAPLAMILLAGRLADVLTGLNNELLSISSHYRFLFRISALLLIVFVALNRILIPRYSFYGAAWGASAALVLYNAAKVIFVYRHFRLQPFHRSTLLLFGIGAVAAVAGYAVPRLGNVPADVVLRSGVVVVVFVALALVLRLSGDLNDVLTRLVRKATRS